MQNEQFSDIPKLSGRKCNDKIIFLTIEKKLINIFAINLNITETNMKKILQVIERN